MCHTSPTDRTFHCQNQQDWCVLILGHRGGCSYIAWKAQNDGMLFVGFVPFASLCGWWFTFQPTVQTPGRQYASKSWNQPGFDAGSKQRTGAVMSRIYSCLLWMLWPQCNSSNFFPGTLQKKGWNMFFPCLVNFAFPPFLSSILALRGSKHQGYQGEVWSSWDLLALGKKHDCTQEPDPKWNWTTLKLNIKFPRHLWWVAMILPQYHEAENFAVTSWERERYIYIYICWFKIPVSQNQHRLTPQKIQRLKRSEIWVWAPTGSLDPVEWRPRHLQLVVPVIKSAVVVGGFNPSEKYSSNGSIIPNIWKNKKCLKPPTSVVVSYWEPGT